MGRSDKDPALPELGPKLRNLRKVSGESLRDIQKRSGLTSGYLSQLERNEVAHPSPSVLRKLAIGYGVDFLVLMQWAGFIDNDELALSPNQAAALNTIGDPSDEELETLQSILALLRSKGTAPCADQLMGSQLDFEARREVAGHSRALLLEAGAFGARPTPLDDLEKVAGLVKAGALDLTPQDKAALRIRFGRHVERAWQRLRGALDFRSRSIWVSPDLSPNQRPFVIAHEIGHGILPAHRAFFAVVDDQRSLSPDVREPFEREANYAATQLLFQCGQLTEEADSSKLHIADICEYATLFGASIVSTAREIAETSRRDVFVAIAYQPRGVLGPTNPHASQSFEKRFRWCVRRAAPIPIRNYLEAATRSLWRTETVVSDVNGKESVLRIETLHTGWAAIALVVRDPGMRFKPRLALSPRTSQPLEPVPT